MKNTNQDRINQFKNMIFKSDEDEDTIEHIDCGYEEFIQFFEDSLRLAEESLARRAREEIGKIPTRCIECDKIGINPYGECQCSYGGEKRYLKKKDILSIPSLQAPTPKGDE